MSDPVVLNTLMNSLLKSLQSVTFSDTTQQFHKGETKFYSRTTAISKFFQNDIARM